LDVPLGKALLGRFSDGEILFPDSGKCSRSGRFCRAAVPTLQWISHLLELLLMIDAFKRASAWRITAVLPYYLLRAQDRKDKPRVPSPQSWSRTCWRPRAPAGALTGICTRRKFSGYFRRNRMHLVWAAGPGGTFPAIEFAEL